MSQWLNYVVESLKGCDIKKVASETKVNHWTLLAIRKGGEHGISNPGVKTVEPLYHYFKRREGKKLRSR